MKIQSLDISFMIITITTHNANILIIITTITVAKLSQNTFWR